MWYRTQRYKGKSDLVRGKGYIKGNNGNVRATAVQCGHQRYDKRNRDMIKETTESQSHDSGNNRKIRETVAQYIMQRYG